MIFVIIIKYWENINIYKKSYYINFCWTYEVIVLKLTLVRQANENLVMYVQDYTITWLYVDI